MCIMAVIVMKGTRLSCVLLIYASLYIVMQTFKGSVQLPASLVRVHYKSATRSVVCNQGSL
jgi:hypothetical protein